METKSTLQIPEGMEFSHVDSESVIHLKRKEKKFPLKSWECLQGRTYYIDASGFIDDLDLCDYGKEEFNHHQTKKQAEAFVAMMQLVTLCRKWNEIDGFTPEWRTASQNKYVLSCVKNTIEIGGHQNVSRPLYFASAERARQFVNAFGDLLETAKELI